jgi:hypothetical protein
VSLVGQSSLHATLQLASVEPTVGCVVSVECVRSSTTYE